MNTPNNRRRRESRQRIEDAFMQLIQHRELKEISVTELCQTASVNRTTFYANYVDLYDLAEAVQKHLEEEVRNLYQEEWEHRNNSHDFLKLFRHIRENPLFYKTYFKLNRDGNFRFADYSIEEAASRFDSRHIEYHIAFFGNGLNAVIRKWLDNGCRETPEEMVSIITEEYSR